MSWVISTFFECRDAKIAKHGATVHDLSSDDRGSQISYERYLDRWLAYQEARDSIIYSRLVLSLEIREEKRGVKCDDAISERDASWDIHETRASHVWQKGDSPMESGTSTWIVGRRDPRFRLNYPSESVWIDARGMERDLKWFEVVSGIFDEVGIHWIAI